MKRSLTRVNAIFLQEMFITKRSLEVIMDIIIFPGMNMVLFGFITVFLQGQINAKIAQYIVMGAMLWEVFRISQYTISVSALWNIWSRNLSNMYVAPLSYEELLSAYAISALVKGVVLFIIFIIIANVFFNFNILTIGIMNIIVGFINLVFFGISVGLMLLAFLFRYGTGIQAITWGIIYLIQPLTASFFPVSVLPKAIQNIAYIFPITYVFEAARAALVDPTFKGNYMLTAFILNVIYFFLFFYFFKRFVNLAKRTGQFSRNEG